MAGPGNGQARDGRAGGLANLFFRGVVTRLRDRAEALVAQVSGRAGELRDNVLIVYPFGFDAWPESASSGHGAEGIVIQLEGDQRVMLPPMDRRHRAKSGVSAQDEAALYTTRARITIRQDGTIEVRGTRLDIQVDGDIAAAAPGGVTFDTPRFAVTGDLIDQTGSGNGLTQAGSRAVYDSHDHNENDSGGPTGAPNQKMG